MTVTLRLTTGILLLAAASRLAAVCPEDFSPLERVIEEERKARGVPGVAAAVVCNGATVFAKGFGEAIAGESIPVTPNTLFRLGSTSKIVTALAAAVLAERGQLDLHKPISTYVPSLPPALAPLTMHQLLSHTAGLRDDAPMDGPHDEAALETHIRSFTPGLALANPGEFFSYSNAGYVLAGFVIQQIAAKPFATAVEELVLRPLGMERSTYRPLTAITYPLAAGHAPGPKVVRPLADHAGAWPPGSLFSTASEMALLLKALLNNGRVAGRQALPAAAIEQVMRPRVEIAPLNRRYGYGIMHRQTAAGQPVALHLGNRTGYSSVFEMSPQESLGIVILSNRTGASMTRSSTRLLSMGGISTEGAATATPPVPNEPIDAAEALRLAGRYRNNGVIAADIVAVSSGSGLALQFAGKTFPIQRTAQPGRYRAPGAMQLESFHIVQAPSGALYLLAEAWALRREPAAVEGAAQ